MSKAAKIIVSFLIALISFAAFAVIAGFASDMGRTPGILGMIVVFAGYGGIKAIWKKKDSNNDITPLQ